MPLTGLAVGVMPVDLLAGSVFVFEGSLGAAATADCPAPPPIFPDHLS